MAKRDVTLARGRFTDPTSAGFSVAGYLFLSPKGLVIVDEFDNVFHRIYKRRGSVYFLEGWPPLRFQSE